jgi:23S rRNA pseudouridine1911/1915/1917 synthase
MRDVVPGALAGQRVDRVVAMMTGLPRSDVAVLIETGGVRVRGAVVSRPSRRLAEGDIVDIDLPERKPKRALVGDPTVVVDVVFADDQVIVVDKHAGLVTHPGAGNAEGTLVHGLLARFDDLAALDTGDPDRPGIVHRLDAGTSGLLVVARTVDAYHSLVEQLSTRTVDRRYRALVLGVVEPATGVVDAPIGRSAADPTRMAVVASGREARTGYEVVRHYRHPIDTTEIICRLETGRTHQIRVHLAAIAHPVVGDGRYGGARPAIPLARPFLHAESLAFDHPRTGERVTFGSPLPADLVDALVGLSGAAPPAV